MNSDLSLKLLFHMKRIRKVEEEIAARYPEGKMRCPTHLSVGQEAVPAAIALTLKHSDFAVGTHRGHAHYLGKGGNLPAMVAEIYGKASGCSGGRGGSMHLIDLKAGFMGTTAIVGNSIPIGVGLGLSIQLHGTDQLSCIFLGDGAVEEGVFYESANFAAVRKLPILFVCENNLYSVYSPLSVRQPHGRSISKMVENLGLRCMSGDGNDALESHRLLAQAVAELRNGSGPIFLEFFTYRWREHCGPFFDNDIGYRSAEEFEYWKGRDPITALETRLLSSQPEAMQAIRAQESEIDAEVMEAFRFAEESPFPEREQAFHGVYA